MHETTWRLEREVNCAGIDMPDSRSHRGPHPEDGRLFDSGHWSALRQAVQDFSWLLSRGYAPPSSLKLVGDRYTLADRQRLAVLRCACTDEARSRRRANEVPPSALAGQTVWLDGYNVLLTVEAALAGGVVLAARDGCFRDLASVHGTYRKVEETDPALRLIGQTLAGWGVAAACWYLDRPVSNSGRLKGVMRSVAEAEGWPWEVELVDSPDAVLRAATAVVATADSAVLDRCQRWVNLARAVVAGHVPHAVMIDLTGDA
jgi:hypothetical protein